MLSARSVRLPWGPIRGPRVSLLKRVFLNIGFIHPSSLSRGHGAVDRDAPPLNRGPLINLGFIHPSSLSLGPGEVDRDAPPLHLCPLSTHRLPPESTRGITSAASNVYKRQGQTPVPIKDS